MKLGTISLKQTLNENWNFNFKWQKVFNFSRVYLPDILDRQTSLRQQLTPLGG